MRDATPIPGASLVQVPAARLAGSEAGVIVHANIEGDANFAAESRALVLRLGQHEFPIQLAPPGGQRLRRESPELRAHRGGLKALLHDRLELAQSVLYQSGVPTSWNLDFYGRCRVGRTAFGTDRIPDGWAERCNTLDELWLPSEFHRETFATSGVERTKIRVVAQAVDTEVFRPGRTPRRLPGLPVRSFYFSAVADEMLASGTDILIDAFVEEFAPDEDVCLVIHCPPSRCGDSYIDFEAEIISLVETKLGKCLDNVPVIALLVGFLSEEDRAGLFAASHAFVQPARADATGRHCLEALSSQLPVIATGWGPHTDFLNERNSFPVATRRLVAAQPDENELFFGHRWAEPDVDHLRHRMREVFRDSNEAARRAERGRRDAIDRFDWGVVLPEWIRNFCRLLA